MAGRPSRSPARWAALALLAVAGLVVGIVVVRTGSSATAGTSGTGYGGFPVVFVMLVIGLPAFLVLSIWLQHKRQERLRAWARLNGWTYATSDRALVHQWSGRPFGVGSSRRATEALRGTFEGAAATSFTYSWTTGSGKSRTTHHAHVVVVALPAYLPTLELTPDGLGGALVRLVGGQDIRFESEAFNRAWLVQSSDPRFAHGVLHPRQLERLLRGDATGTSLRIEGRSILSWETGSTDLARLAPRLGLLTGVVRGIPRHVWQDHGYDPMTNQSTRGIS
ncbi:hypothetical protein [Cellulomonas hominis]